MLHSFRVKEYLMDFTGRSTIDVSFVNEGGVCTFSDKSEQLH
jgi:hypothetical protein